MKQALSILVNLVLLIQTFGFEQLTGRIVGGDYAEDYEFPYQVSLRVRNGTEHVCGGAIVSEKYVLTAGHCVTSTKGTATIPLIPEAFSVYAGSIYLSHSDGVLIGVKKIHVSNNYAFSKHTYDIALLELNKSFKFNDAIQPIELATEEIPDKSLVIISGWGRIYTNGPKPKSLKYALTIKLPKKLCYHDDPNGDGVLCLLHEEDVGACNGDSGGPATYDGKLVGIANFVVQECGSKYPDGYAKVSHYLDWIKQYLHK